MPGFLSIPDSVPDPTELLFANNADFTGSANASNANGILTNGQLWIGSTAANAGGTHINVGNIVSTNAGIAIGYASPNITLTLAGGGVGIDSIAVQTGTSPVVPDGTGLVTMNGAVVAAGTNPVRTNGTAATVLAVEVQTSQALGAADATRIGLSNFDIAAFDVDATGFVQLKDGGIAATSFDVQANTAPGTDPVVPTAAGVVTVNGAAVANHSVVLETRSRAANAYNVEVQYATAEPATDATKSGVSHFSNASFAVDANGFVTLSGTGAGTTITGDSGGPLSPTANNWNILGGPGVTTSGAGSTLTINSTVFTDTTAITLSVDNGYFATAAGTYPLPATAEQGELITVVCDTAGAVVLDAPALNFIRVGSGITAADGTATSNAIGDSLTLRYRLATLTWEATSVIGTWTLV